MAQVDVLGPATVSENSEGAMILKDGLRFVFQGYAIWLEAEQFPNSEVPKNGVPLKDVPNNDLEHAIGIASHELDVHPIPAPHLTALYGITHLSEREARRRFQELASRLQAAEHWPVLEPTGFLSEIESEGVNGGEMNMAWIEASFRTSPEHEEIIDQIYECFYKGTGKVRDGQWCPHVSLAYDNDDTPISKEYLNTLVERFPTLGFPRKIQSISLWDLNGTIHNWKLLDRVSLDPDSSAKLIDE